MLNSAIYIQINHIIFNVLISCQTQTFNIFRFNYVSNNHIFYVDGACKGNPGLGGWGAYIITEQGEHKLCGGEPETTNNRMELQAAIEGVSFALQTHI